MYELAGTKMAAAVSVAPPLDCLLDLFARYRYTNAYETLWDRSKTRYNSNLLAGCLSGVVFCLYNRLNTR